MDKWLALQLPMRQSGVIVFFMLFLYCTIVTASMLEVYYVAAVRCLKAMSASKLLYVELYQLRYSV